MLPSKNSRPPGQTSIAGRTNIDSRSSLTFIMSSHLSRLLKNTKCYAQDVFPKAVFSVPKSLWKCHQSKYITFLQRNKIFFINSNNKHFRWRCFWKFWTISKIFEICWKNKWKSWRKLFDEKMIFRKFSKTETEGKSIWHDESQWAAKESTSLKKDFERSTRRVIPIILWIRTN